MYDVYHLCACLMSLEVREDIRSPGTVMTVVGSHVGPGT